MSFAVAEDSLSLFVCEHKMKLSDDQKTLTFDLSSCDPADVDELKVSFDAGRLRCEVCILS